MTLKSSSPLLLPASCAALTLALLYAFPLRRWFAHWGTTPGERTRVMAGDAVIAHPTHSSTLAVTVDSPPQDIWPWLAQMGYGRGGLYSYDWLDRLAGILNHPSSNRILPQFQQLAVGDRILLGPARRGEALTVAALDPPRTLVFSYKEHGIEWVWQFGLYPLGHNRTRLVTRGAERIPHTLNGWLFMRALEPAAFIMTRRMLLVLKQRAESLRPPGVNSKTERPWANRPRLGEL